VGVLIEPQERHIIRILLPSAFDNDGKPSPDWCWILHVACPALGPAAQSDSRACSPTNNVTVNDRQIAIATRLSPDLYADVLADVEVWGLEND
jgi:hypothetical protein